MRRDRILLLVPILLLGALSALAASPPVVFHSPADNGVDPGPPHALVPGVQTLFLYARPGPVASHASKPPTGKRLLGAGPRNDVVPSGHCP
jgi:hypothetical protein